MTISLKKQIILAFLTIILTITGIDIMCNRYLLDDYYLNSKENMLVTTASKIEKNLEDIQDIDFLNNIQRDCRINNLSLLVINEAQVPFICFYNKEDEELIIKRLNMYMAENKNEDYVLREVQNGALGINYLEICGKLSNGYHYIIKTPIDSIKNTASLSTLFLVYILIFLLPVSIMIILIITDKITQPLTKLTNVSKKIANLDFSEECKLEGSIEIIELSKNFNKMSNELETKIGELKTANANLKKDLDEKAELEEMRKEFLSNVSHELKTPIAIISGYSESLKDSIDDPEDIAFYSDIIFDETQKLSRMVKEILDINKLELQTIQVSISKIKLNDLIQNILVPLQKSIDEKQISLKINIPKNCFIWTDEKLLYHIISNYLTNALDHVNKSGTIEITLELNKDKYILKVYNSGSSIPEEYLDRVWEKFFKVDKSRTREFGGTGLGLAIVKTYANALKQNYGVKNKNNGVEFFITIDK